MPWQLSYAASADLENSELQTDVMRFMAILAFCLVAIFAIVQSMPLDMTPVVEDKKSAALAKTVISEQVVSVPVAPVKTKTEVVESRVREPVPAKVIQPASKPIAKSLAPRKVVTKAVVMPQAPIVPVLPAKPLPDQASKPTPVPATVPAPARLEPPPAPASSIEPQDRGLSLRFQSDTVLRSLVERGQVSLYAIRNDTYFEMQAAGQRLGFTSGSKPSSYHEMVFRTVPQEVATAFENQTGLSAKSVTWGVTLPVATTSQLQRFASTRFSGGLVIDENATLLLDREQ